MAEYDFTLPAASTTPVGGSSGGGSGSGAGFMPPAGVSLAGFFLEERFVDETRPPGILADAIDPRTGELLSIVRGFEPTDAAVLVALVTKRRSGAAVDTVGQRFEDIRMVDPSTPGAIRSEVDTALAHLTVDKQITLHSVNPVVGSDWAEAQVVYINRAQNKRREPTILVGT